MGCQIHTDHETDQPCPWCRIAELERAHDEARAYAGHWRDVAKDLDEPRDSFPWEGE